MSNNVFGHAKAEWQKAADYEKMEYGTSTFVGISGDGNAFVVNPGQGGVSTLSVQGGVIVTKELTGPRFTIIDSAALMRVSNGDTNGLDGVDVSIFEAHAGAEGSSTYVGAGAGITLAGGSVSIFDFNLGAGVSTGAGIKDDSISVKVAGVGGSVGRKISISVLDNSFGIDLYRMGKGIVFLASPIGDALADAGSDLAKVPGQLGTAIVEAGESLSKVPGQLGTAIIDAGKAFNPSNW